MNKNGKVNIYQLAELTGYSVSTVSKALNKTGRISEATREKILKIAREHNYIASYHAKSLSSKDSYIIAIIFSDNLNTGLSHPFFSVILEHFKQEVEREGYEVTFVNRNMGKSEMTYLEFCKYRNVDGVFIVNYYSLSRQIPELIESGIPVVCADQGNNEITTVVSDDFMGGEKAGDYLVSLGHTNIFHIAGPLYTISAQKRLQGFEHAMRKHGVKTYKVVEAPNYGVEDGYQKALDIMGEKTLPTAVFVASDWMALGAIKAFQDNGYSVPNDISIIGFDNIEFLQYSSPALTTVSQNKREIGITAAKSLISKIKGEEVSSSLIDVDVVERETCKKIN